MSTEKAKWTAGAERLAGQSATSSAAAVVDPMKNRKILEQLQEKKRQMVLNKKQQLEGNNVNHDHASEESASSADRAPIVGQQPRHGSASGSRPPPRHPAPTVEQYLTGQLDACINHLNANKKPAEDRRTDRRLQSLITLDDEQRSLADEWHVKPSTSSGVYDRLPDYCASTSIPPSALTVDRTRRKHVYNRCVPGTQTEGEQTALCNAFNNDDMFAGGGGRSTKTARKRKAQTMDDEGDAEDGEID